MDTLTDVQAVAAEAFATLDTGRQIGPFSSRLSFFDLDDAYRVTAVVRKMRETAGSCPSDERLGSRIARFGPNTTYTNRSGDMFTIARCTTLRDRRNVPARGSREPRIEPEIVFKLAVVPAPGMGEGALLESIDWVAHGFEIVQSIFPGWKFSAPDTVAAFGLHGALLIGPRHSIAGHTEDWGRTLPTFEIDLKRDGTVVDHGRATNVLGGPVSALRHLIDILARGQINPPLAAGEIVTTGTLTRALPVSARETWTTELAGLALNGICVHFT